MDTPASTNNPTIEKIDANAYYESLLESQLGESRDIKMGDSIRRFKMISLLFLILVICVSLYLAVSFYIRTNSIKEHTAPDLSENINSGAYFNPEYYSETNRVISGKIEKNFDNTGDKTMAFKLLDQNGTTISYLFSKTNDLNLSLGLNVEIQGEMRKNTLEGQEVIEITSIKLK